MKEKIIVEIRKTTATDLRQSKKELQRALFLIIINLMRHQLPHEVLWLLQPGLQHRKLLRPQLLPEHQL